MINIESTSLTEWFGGRLQQWYHLHKRDLPWRATSNPYYIWVSEVILQQTRVAQGHSYYLRFVDRFPTIQALASAEEDEVLKYWEGLGYYSRARNLHAAAKEVMELYHGRFPESYPDILSLKGIGEYTAAAIASFAYDQPRAVVDGNVFRVLSRVFGLESPIDTSFGKKKFQELAQMLLDENNPGLYNQAIMEFGALQCVPVNPVCSVCPLEDKCVALELDKVSVLPHKSLKKKVQSRYLNYFEVRCGDKILVCKRTGNDIWKNLYELPLIETSCDFSWEEMRQSDLFRELFSGVSILKVSGGAKVWKHVLTHRIIYAKFYEVEVNEFASLLNRYMAVSSQEREDIAFSRLVNKYLDMK